MIRRSMCYALARDTPLRVLANGLRQNAMLRRLDGLYALCELTTSAGAARFFHLSAYTPMVEVDGRWEIDTAAGRP